MICLMVCYSAQSVDLYRVQCQHTSTTEALEGFTKVQTSQPARASAASSSSVPPEQPRCALHHAAYVATVLQYHNSREAAEAITAKGPKPSPAFDPLKRAQKKKPAPPAIPPDVFGGQGIPPELQSLLAELTAGAPVSHHADVHAHPQHPPQLFPTMWMLSPAPVDATWTPPSTPLPSSLRTSSSAQCVVKGPSLAPVTGTSPRRSKQARTQALKAWQTTHRCAPVYGSIANTPLNTPMHCLDLCAPGIHVDATDARPRGLHHATAPLKRSALPTNEGMHTHGVALMPTCHVTHLGSLHCVLPVYRTSPPGHSQFLHVVSRCVYPGLKSAIVPMPTGNRRQVSRLAGCQSGVVASRGSGPV